MKRIKLTQGKFALVDDEDYEWLNQWKWYASRHRKTFYVVRNRLKSEVNMPRRIRMHRVILGLLHQKTVLGDHKDGNGLDNRRGNIRACNGSGNQHNQPMRKNNSSGFKGVSWFKKTKQWMAKICLNRKQKYIGLYDNRIEAARAYDSAALELFGEFACLNFNIKEKP